VIRREFDISEGDAYNRALVDRAERRLKNLDYFKTVKITTEPGSSSDRVVLIVDLEEKSTGDFSVSGGYSTTDGALAEVSVSERNLLGRGLFAKASVTYGQYARGYSLSFVEPYLLDYRVAPCDMCAPLADIKRAVRVVRSMGYERVAILGFSAGGHLVCSAATMYDRGTPDAKDPVERLSSRPDAFVPCYAVVSFAAFLHSGSRQTLLGEKAEDWPTIRRFSAELHITEDTPEAFIWHTAADQGVPVENSLRLASALAVNGVPFELHIFPFGRHGLGLAKDMPDVAQWANLLQNWLKLRNYN
jgi:dienelactone hydrolase